MSQPKTNLLNFDTKAMTSYFMALGEKPYRAQQMVKWIHQSAITDFDDMTNLSKVLRAQLTENAEIKTPEIMLDRLSEDGTRKWLLKLDCGNCVETVYIPERDRGTLCISSQIGCALNCTFCATGAQGFNRDLKTSEII